MSDTTPTPQFEEEIRAAVAVPLAHEEFVKRLHARLIQQAASQPKVNRPIFLRPAWVVASVMVVLVIGILLIGPQRVQPDGLSAWGWDCGSKRPDTGSGRTGQSHARWCDRARVPGYPDRRPNPDCLSGIWRSTLGLS